MPFITPENRKKVNDWLESKGIVDVSVMEPGDHCYMYYKEMVRKWKKNPRWTTAHNIYKDLLRAKMPHSSDPLYSTYEDVYVAEHLAWQVFFQTYVMPYEMLKREQNGDI